MNQQIAEYLRLIGLTECLLGVLLVVLIFMAQRMWKRIDGMSLLLLAMVPEAQIKTRLDELARKVEDAEEKRDRA